MESDDAIEWITLCVAVCLVGYVGLRLMRIKDRVRDRPSVRYEDLEFKTGDLVLFHTNVWLMFLLDSPFNYVGMVVVRDGVPYVYEIVPEHGTPTLTAVNRRTMVGAFYRSIDLPLENVGEAILRQNTTYDFSTWEPLPHDVRVLVLAGCHGAKVVVHVVCDVDRSVGPAVRHHGGQVALRARGFSTHVGRWGRNAVWYELLDGHDRLVRGPALLSPCRHSRP